MPRWDFECRACQRTYELTFKTYAESQTATCPQCGVSVVRQPASPSFVVHGYNAKNNYAK